MRVLGIIGSLRAESHNRRLLRAAADKLPPDTELVTFEGLKSVEPIDETDEHENGGGMPGVDTLFAAIRSATRFCSSPPSTTGQSPAFSRMPGTGNRVRRPRRHRSPTSLWR
jgi:chromate reductase